MSSDQIWSYVGKFLAIIGGIAALIKIIESFASPRHKLVATIQNVPNLEPPKANKPREKHYPERLLWIISICNYGKKPCEEITLVLPSAWLACISREGKDEECRELKHGVITLETIDPGEIISIDAWGDQRFQSWDRIRLSHSSGIGKLRILLPTRKFFHYLDEILADKSFQFLIIIILILIGLQSILSFKKAAGHDQLSSQTTNSLFHSTNSDVSTHKN